jgi:histone H3/H4
MRTILIHSYVAALAAIRKFQSSTETLIPRRSFQRLVREIGVDILKTMPPLHKTAPDEYHWQRQALEALQESTKMYLVQLFEDTQLVAIHAGCITIHPRDMQLIQWLHTSEWRSVSTAGPAQRRFVPPASQEKVSMLKHDAHWCACSYVMHTGAHAHM